LAVVVDPEALDRFVTSVIDRWENEYEVMAHEKDALQDLLMDGIAFHFPSIGRRGMVVNP
jgi:hypothetical protein